jgi:prolyl oligopeptidase
MEKQNDITTNQLTLDPRFAGVEKYLKSVYSSKEKLNLGDIQGQFVYNFTSDNKNVRGRWQRTRISEYNKKITKWETVLDIDKLSVDENVKWVFKGANCLAPFYEVCLLKLSKGGKDAGVYREFNTRTKTFVANGFFLPEAKSSAS